MKYIGLILLLYCTAGFSQTNTVKIDSIATLTGTISTFDSQEHYMDTCETKMNWNYICLIDGKPWFGSDNGWNLPRNQLMKLELNLHGQNISLDVSGMYNPNYENSIRANQFKIKEGEGVYYLYGFFSDGAGGYTCHWKIVNGTSIRLKISNDERDFFWQLEE